jgi:hypothetical protein
LERTRYQRASFGKLRGRATQAQRYAAIAQNAYETFSSTDFDFSSDAFSEQLSLCQTMAWDRASAVDSS